MSINTIRLILGDQLNEDHSWFREPSNDGVMYVMMETLSETSYVTHHIQKILAFFLAMRDFAERLKQKGHRVLYLRLDDPENLQSIPDNILRIISESSVSSFEYQLPDEYRLDRQLVELEKELEIPVKQVDTEHFLSERSAVKDLFKGKKQYLMETFYRSMRKKYHILMEPDGKNPLSGRWNYDAENRKKLPDSVRIPPVLRLPPKDVEGMVALLEKMKVKTIGNLPEGKINWPVNREEAELILADFLENRLPFFGTYQDALSSRDPFLFHSRLSFALNVKLIHPLYVIKRATDFWYANQTKISLSQVEGFVRQILGWREFIRGIYWAEMPGYAVLNFFDHQLPLPEFYWTGKTRMYCMSQAIGQSLEKAYAHHIQRLMVTGNFALLLGVDPDEIDGWYLGIYIDALEWVELPNTRGMSQFADGGIVGTKPYVSSANYIQKMGDHCKSCHYDPKAKLGERACPFNSLYWDFYDRHREKLEKNPRIGMMYRVWDKMSPGDKEAILRQAAWIKTNAGQL